MLDFSDPSVDYTMRASQNGTCCYLLLEGTGLILFTEAALTEGAFFHIGVTLRSPTPGAYTLLQGPGGRADQ